MSNGVDSPGFEYFTEVFSKEYKVDKSVLSGVARQVWENELTDADRASWDEMARQSLSRQAAPSQAEAEEVAEEVVEELTVLASGHDAAPASPAEAEPTPELPRGTPRAAVLQDDLPLDLEDIHLDFPMPQAAEPAATPTAEAFQKTPAQAEPMPEGLEDINLNDLLLGGPAGLASPEEEARAAKATTGASVGSTAPMASLVFTPPSSLQAEPLAEPAVEPMPEESPAASADTGPLESLESLEPLSPLEPLEPLEPMPLEQPEEADAAPALPLPQEAESPAAAEAAAGESPAEAAVAPPAEAPEAAGEPEAPAASEIEAEAKEAMEAKEAKEEEEEEEEPVFSLEDEVLPEEEETPPATQASQEEAPAPQDMAAEPLPAAPSDLQASATDEFTFQLDDAGGPTATAAPGLTPHPAPESASELAAALLPEPAVLPEPTPPPAPEPTARPSLVLPPLPPLAQAVLTAPEPLAPGEAGVPPATPSEPLPPATPEPPATPPAEEKMPPAMSLELQREILSRLAARHPLPRDKVAPAAPADQADQAAPSRAGVADRLQRAVPPQAAAAPAKATPPGQDAALGQTLAGRSRREGKAERAQERHGIPQQHVHPAIFAKVRQYLEDHTLAMTKVMVERALKGDSQCLTWCLDHVWPRPETSTPPLEIPTLNTQEEVLAFGAAIFRALSQGGLTLEQADGYMALLKNYMSLLEMDDFKKRLLSLEQSLRGGGGGGVKRQKITLGAFDKPF